MTSPTLDRDVAEAIYRLVRDFETEKIWTKPTTEEKSPVEIFDRKDGYVLVGRWSNAIEAGFKWYPAPSFSELIRILPNIGEKSGWAGNSVRTSTGMVIRAIPDAEIHAVEMAKVYMFAPTAEEGMKRVSDYLRKIL